jgi:hypothetical protein
LSTAVSAKAGTAIVSSTRSNILQSGPRYSLTKRQTRVNESLAALLKFLDLCRGLADLTDEEPELQGLRNLFLGYYEYWFRAARNSHTSEMIKDIEQILQLLDSQKSEVRVYLDGFRKLDYRVTTLPAIINGPERIAAKKEVERAAD